MAAAPTGDAADEILIAGRVRAHLLGLRLLTLDARVTVGPGDGARVLAAPGRLGRPCGCGARGRRRFRGRAVPVGGMRRRATQPGTVTEGGGREGRRPPVGDGLARSERLVGQATAVLAEVSDR